MPPFISYKSCTAKTTKDNQPGISVQEHCEYVGEVAKALLRRLPGAAKHLISDDIVTLVALHDIGKVSPGYQKKYFSKNLKSLSPELHSYDLASFETNHAEVSDASIRSWFIDHYRNNQDVEKWGSVLGSHHGRSVIPKLDGAESYGGVEWQHERHKLIEIIIGKFGPLPTSPPISPEQLHVISGLICIADWIASDEEFFPPEGLPEGSDIEKRVDSALDQCGWIFPKIKRGMLFQNVFGFDTPNPTQSAILEIAKEPGLYIIEAPMGQGKTEAALYVAYQLISSGHNFGIYFGLPTRLTSERIYERVIDFLNTATTQPSSARLIHGQAWLRAGGEEFHPGMSWFTPRKRALLLPFGVGTVDQALLSIMRVKHHFVRSFGLAGKVVILDEVHSYDVYTGTLLDALVSYLLKMGCSVIILSATLTQSRRVKFLSGSGSAQSDNYPLITTQYSGKKISTVAPTPLPSTPIDITMTKDSTGDLVQKAIERAEQGQCVLWICNTVAESQHCYKAVKNRMREGVFEVGLLHSRFPTYRREKLESEWMSLLGKLGDRPKGCILVATQVVEQSVDIDADFLITELAPTDMLLQRIGRLWRHERKDRAGSKPEVLIVSGNIKETCDMQSFKEALGRSFFVYAPYVLWRSYQVWQNVESVQLPGEVRNLLEATYYPPKEREPAFIEEAREKLDKKRDELREMAMGGLAESMPLMDDDEQVATRYSTQRQVQVLLIRNVKRANTTTDIVLSDGERVSVNEKERDFETAKKLYRNLVSVSRYFFSSVSRPHYLKKHVYGDVVVLRIGEDGRLFDEAGIQLPLKYSNSVGVERVEDELFTVNRFNNEEEGYELDW